MKLSQLTLTAAVIATSHAQSAPDFPVTVTEYLPVNYGDVSVLPVGVLLPRPDVLEAPVVSRPATAQTNTPYVLFMIDQDVPRNDSRVTILHWLQPNLYASQDAFSVVTVADGASTAVGAEYIPPTPPEDIAHRYTFILYEQPSLWTIPASYVTINPPADTSARVGFNLTEFVAASGLGEPIAANYLRVINGTSAESSSAATETFVGASTMMSSSTMDTEATATTGTGTMTEPPASATTEAGTATSAMASETAAAEDGAMTMRGNAKEVFIGLAMGVVGAGLWMM